MLVCGSVGFEGFDESPHPLFRNPVRFGLYGIQTGIEFRFEMTFVAVASSGIMYVWNRWNRPRCVGGHVSHPLWKSVASSDSKVRRSFATPCMCGSVCVGHHRDIRSLGFQDGSIDFPHQRVHHGTGIRIETTDRGEIVFSL